MLRIFSFLFLFVSVILADNIQKLGNWYPGEFCNDIWGYDAPDGRYYAIMGAQSGTYVLDVTDPASIQKVGYVAGSSSTWRDIKTYRHYAYVTNETFGLDIIDLQDAPNSIRHVQMMNVQNFHNLYIDTTTATMYCADASSSGSVHIFSLADPENPVEINTFGTESHDIYVRDSIAYVSQGRQASIGIYDVSDPMNVVTLKTIHIPNGGYAHNSWLNESGEYLISTEETAGKTVKMWDIRDLNNIEMVSEGLGANQLAHNAHIEGEFAYVSHYEAGLVIFDVSHPDKMALVGNYDTYPEDNHSNYNGDWGVFPHSRSGNVYVSDEDRGLFVFEFNGTHASYYKGVVRDAQTLQPVSAARYELNGNETGRTDENGLYDFGVGLSEDATLEVNAYGYQTATLTLSPNGGVTDSMDILLNSAPRTDFQVVVQTEDGVPLQGFQVAFQAESRWLDAPQSHTAMTDANGSARFEDLPVSDGDAAYYTHFVVTGQFPYATVTEDTIALENQPENNITVEMRPADVLVINSDPNGAYGEYLEEALNEQGYSDFVLATQKEGRLPSLEDIRLFQTPHVIWMTGDASVDVLPPAAQDSIIRYLKNGINVILTGQNIAEYLNQENPAFLSDWLGASFIDNSNSKILKGNAEHPIGSQINRIGLYASQAAANQVSQDMLLADSSRGAGAALYYGGSTYNAAAVTRVFEDYGSALFFAGFGMEAVYKSSSTMVTRGELINDIFNWFESPTALKPIQNITLNAFDLRPNYPNPFNPSTRIVFDVPHASHLRLSVFDVTGKEVTTLIDRTLSPGRHQVTFQAKDLASGVYFYRLQTKEFTQTRRMLLIR